MSAGKLPFGVWTKFSYLPSNITEAELSAFFHECGLAIPPECISIRQFRRNAGAIVSVPFSVVNDVLAWALENVQLGGCCVEPEIMHKGESS